MKNEKLIDVLIIIAISIFVFVAIYFNWFETYKGFSLIPFLVVYYLGKYIGGRGRSSKNSKKIEL